MGNIARQGRFPLWRTRSIAQFDAESQLPGAAISANLGQTEGRANMTSSRTLTALRREPET